MGIRFGERTKQLCLGLRWVWSKARLSNQLVQQRFLALLWQIYSRALKERIEEVFGRAL